MRTEEEIKIKKAYCKGMLANSATLDIDILKKVEGRIEALDWILENLSDDEFEDLVF